MDGAALARLRGRVLDVMDEALQLVASDGRLVVSPGAEVLVVDRRAWIAGNIRTLRKLFGEGPLVGVQAKVVAWEAGAFLGLLARAVLAQYDPFRDVFLIVYPNLGEVAEGDALRWLVLHEATHLGQFRTAPWMEQYILDLGNEVLSLDDPSWMRDAARRLASGLPDIVAWLRRAMAGQPDGTTPLLDLLPPQQKSTLLRLHALLTLLEGHATYLTDVVCAREIPDYERMQSRIRERRRRPPILRLLEAIAGIEMKRQQYVQGRGFCEAVWKQGGAEALVPAWQSADNLPTPDELRDPSSWLARVR